VAALDVPRPLSVRALNRALLARQWLLRRVKKSVPATIEHLVGLQAQNTLPPYVALWSRLDAFEPEALSRLLTSRRAVRLALLRSTIHLVTARDCLALRPALQPALERGFYVGSPYGKRLAKLDVKAIVAAGRALLDDEPRTTSDLGAALTKRWPGADAEALGNALRAFLALVQVPPRGVWGQGGQPRCTTAEAWLGQPLARETAPDALVTRYLAAFGPATAADLQAWSGLPACAEILARMRPGLRVLGDERGRALFDVARAPLPDEDTPAPVRFLPEYDNAFLSHVDRARIVSAADLPRLKAGNGFLAPFLVDGFVRGTWRITRAGDAATLTLAPMRKLAASERADVETEGARLLAFLAPDARRRDVRVARA
jgi:hypothetical protein